MSCAWGQNDRQRLLEVMTHTGKKLFLPRHGHCLIAHQRPGTQFVRRTSVGDVASDGIQ
jgi:hypothetical protein